MRRLTCSILTVVLAALASGSAVVRAASGPAAVDPAYFGNLQWRMIGPFRGGRALAVTGVPGEPDRFYFGAVDGGVWESSNAGRTWNPIFDGEPVGSIGAIAVAPSDPRTIYVGTGEADMRSDIAYGDGVYKSADGGKTWRHVGLDDTRQIGKILVDPQNPDVVYVAALGHAYGPNAERGVFKSTDGGGTWTKVLFKDADTGAIDLAFDPADAHTIYAALWQTRRPPWNVYPPSNGPGSGLYKSTDAGATWTHVTNGLPARVGRIGLATTPANPQRVYATVDSDAAHGGVYRSDDAGATWTHVDGDSRIWQRGWYFGEIAADPKNADVAYVMNTSTYRTADGGKSFTAILGDPTGDDYHALWIEPNDPSRMILGSDQGVVVTVDGAKTWSSWYNQPTAQFYHVVADDAFPYWLYGAQQDSGAAMAPSATSQYSTISQQDFRPIDVGGENGYLAPDPRHPGLVFGGTVSKELVATGWEQDVDPTIDRPGTIWRNTWTMPVAFSPADKTSLYFGRQNVFRTRDGGASWQIVSPDLSRSDEGAPSNLDASTLADDNNVRRHGVVYSIGPSPLRAGTVWAGTDDGYVWLTTDDCAHWHNVTPPGVGSWSKIALVEASHFDPQTAYVAVDRHRLDDYAPYVYRTTDGGKTWTSIAAGIPNGSFVNAVREDPVQRGLLYAGTEKGVYVSFDDGAHWQSLELNMPVTSIRDVAIHGDDVAVATHGRAFWVLDDAVSLRQMAAAVAARGNYLFAPGVAYRVRYGNNFNGGGTPLPLDEPQAQNRVAGVFVDYYLDGAARTPVVIEALDERGALLGRWSSAETPKAVDPNSVDFTTHWIVAHPVPYAGAGAHRFVWNFGRGGADGPLVPPGRYAIRLSVDGRTYVRTAVVRRDPRVPATDADLRSQYEFALEIGALRERVRASRATAQGRLAHSALSAAERQLLRTDVVGVEPAVNPDDSEGVYSHDFTSFLYVQSALENLEFAVESADAAPTPTMRDAYVKLDAIYVRTLARANALAPR
ncbi:MAG TPA: hypothetical protein VMF61_11090 [Candidatus Acidoferrales bacterium]|nr:hypothetical protein [Candidatus Acidoferrales bacterium]